MNGEYAIDVRDLNKHFGDKHVVRNVSLQVKPGEIFGFLGPNGSGKTTTIRMLCGLLTPDSGSGTCLGFDILRESGQIKRQAGYMTQKFSYWDDLTLRENLDFVARMYGLKPRRKIVDAALAELGLVERADQLTGALSGGWKQRLALAACMLHEPKLLLLDEPTAGVDPKARRDFWDEIHQLAHEGITVLVSTHYMDEAERCHRLGYIAYGRLLATGTPSELVHQSGLHTWRVTGDEVTILAQALEQQHGVELVTRFGNALHVCGRDADRLAQAIAPYRHDPDLRWHEAAPQLEDVFIHLMQQSADNYAPA